SMSSSPARTSCWCAACWRTRTRLPPRRPGGTGRPGSSLWRRRTPGPCRRASWLQRSGPRVWGRWRSPRIGRRDSAAVLPKSSSGPGQCSASAGRSFWSDRPGGSCAACCEPPVAHGRCHGVKAIVLEEFGEPDVLQLRDLPDPEPGPGEVLVRVAAAGVCYHDLLTRAGHIRHGLTLPVVPGHEVAGVVEAVGEGVTSLAPGDRVCTVQLATCGECDAWLSGNDHVCRWQRMFGHGLAGGYAEYLVAPARSLVPVPDGIPLEQAALFGCGIGTSYQALTTTSRLQAG